MRNRNYPGWGKGIGILVCGMAISMLYACQVGSQVELAQPADGLWRREQTALLSGLSGQRTTFDEIQEQKLQAVLQQYEAYAEANPDYVGWLYLEDTLVDGPVVQSQLDGNGYWEYLYKDFDGNYKFAGTLFLDKSCSIEEPATANWMIYGHNMNDGSMFGTLKYYRDEAFWREHPTFTFTTRTQVETFEILGVVQSWVSDYPQGQFEYFYFFDAENEESFDAFVQQVKDNALYDTGVEAEYGDQLITLTTCDSWHEEGRLAIIGRKKGL
ncbi:MAG: class B sortase [Bacteroides sp.]|nr:class B sortase [Bacteroides sp.]MCM1548509.1 class B sortase [Clostridium sp.]